MLAGLTKKKRITAPKRRQEGADFPRGPVPFCPIGGRPTTQKKLT
jgi:hypothetical protein